MIIITICILYFIYHTHTDDFTLNEYPPSVNKSVCLEPFVPTDMTRGVENLVVTDKNGRPLILSDKNRGNVDSTCHQPVINDVVTYC